MAASDGATRAMWQAAHAAATGRSDDHQTDSGIFSISFSSVIGYSRTRTPVAL